jgi:rhamnose utilization protein RhaD (predicted bifunctional aldolase and dehydrogenase)
MNKKFLEFSQSIGSNLDLVQAAGGNTSVKEGNNLWVKASGLWLSDALNKEIFGVIDLDKFKKDLVVNNNKLIAQDFISSEYYPQSLKPSIETFLHLLMPHKYVFHIHSVNIISNSILLDGKQLFMKLLKGLNWQWVRYVRPGMPLAKEVQSVINLKPDIIVLANHGVLFGAETLDEATKLLHEIESRVNRKRRAYDLNIDIDRAKSIIMNSDYCISSSSLVNSVAFDDVSCRIVSIGTLYPDHVVFLGPGPMNLMNIGEFEHFIEVGNKNYNNDKKDVIIVKNLGVFILTNLSESKKAMLDCLANVLLRINPHDKLRYLNTYEENELVNWDAEKYRKSIEG